MSQKPKILIIDDDEDARAFYSAVLGDDNYDFVMAENGEEGLQELRQGKADLILLDLLMPGKSGVKFFNELKESEGISGIPVIIISGATRVTGVDMKTYILQRPYHERKEEVKGKKIETRPVEFLEKPVDPDELIKEVESALCQ